MIALLALALASAPETSDRKVLAQAPNLSLELLTLARRAHARAKQRGLVHRDRMTIIDYSLPSTEERLFIVDLDRNLVERVELVAHGRNSGANHAQRFSNDVGSLKSSVGVYRTLGTYRGKHGYSLRLDGLEPGFNDHAKLRAIVVHGAWYVSRAFAKRHGRLGRSWGCPAVAKKVARPLIDQIKNGTLMLIYYPDANWLRGSTFVRS